MTSKELCSLSWRYGLKTSYINYCIFNWETAKASSSLKRCSQQCKKEGSFLFSCTRTKGKITNLTICSSDYRRNEGNPSQSPEKSPVLEVAYLSVKITSRNKNVITSCFSSPEYIAVRFKLCCCFFVMWTKVTQEQLLCSSLQYIC